MDQPCISEPCISEPCISESCMEKTKALPDLTRIIETQPFKNYTTLKYEVIAPQHWNNCCIAFRLLVLGGVGVIAYQALSG